MFTKKLPVHIDVRGLSILRKINNCLSLSQKHYNDRNFIHRTFPPRVSPKPQMKYLKSYCFVALEKQGNSYFSSKSLVLMI